MNSVSPLECSITDREAAVCIVFNTKMSKTTGLIN